ncbi:hypothetical protein HYV57_02335, partial [Candidatus Peregrinibacteria bacterium]|nr:hypothetical protein [Candidatus Peregrinibacteria bacterium]
MPKVCKKITDKNVSKVRSMNQRKEPLKSFFLIGVTMLLLNFLFISHLDYDIQSNLKVKIPVIQQLVSDIFQQSLSTPSALAQALSIPSALAQSLSTPSVFSKEPSVTVVNSATNGFFPIPPPENFGNPPHPSDINAKGTDIIMQLAYGIYNNLKGIISGLAIAFLIFSGFQMVTANNDEQTITEQKNHMLWSFLGLILLAITHGIQKIFECRVVGGTQTLCIFQDPTEIVRRVGYFDKQLEIVLTFGRYIIGSIAILYLILSAAKLITGGDNDETVTKSKKNFGVILLGLIVIIVSDFLINDVLYTLHKSSTPIAGQGVNPGIATDKGLEFLGQLSKFVVGFAGP